MGLIRFVLRVAATLSLAVAVILVVLDATRSIAADALVTTPLGAAWQAFSPATLEQARQALSGLADVLWNPAAIAVLAMPGFLVFLILAVILFILGRAPRRRPVSGRP